MADWTLPNRSVEGCVEAVADDGGVENAFQSPNSPFPFGVAAPAGQGMVSFVAHYISQVHPKDSFKRVKREVPMLDGRLAEAAGEEKSANPAMSSELLPENTDTKHQTHQQVSISAENSFFKP